MARKAQSVGASCKSGYYHFTSFVDNQKTIFIFALNSLEFKFYFYHIQKTSNHSKWNKDKTCQSECPFMFMKDVLITKQVPYGNERSKHVN